MAVEAKADDIPPPTGPQQAEADAVVRAALRFADATTIRLLDDASEDLVITSGRTVKSLKPFIDEYRTRPERKQGTSELTTIQSFIDQAKRSMDENSVIFADVANRTEPKLIAVFDYNQAGPAGEPRFGKHRALYRFPVSEQWKAWTKEPLESLGQVPFAEFLEARIMDVMDVGNMPSKTLEAFCQQLGVKLGSPQTLMELSRGLTVHAEHRVLQNVNLSSGEAQLGFSENHTDATGAPVKIPGGFAIAIPVFRNGPAYQIPVRLRYRLAGGQVRWTLQPQRLDEIWDDSVNEAVEMVAHETALVTLFGTPEA